MLVDALPLEVSKQTWMFHGLEETTFTAASSIYGVYTSDGPRDWMAPQCPSLTSTTNKLLAYKV